MTKQHNKESGFTLVELAIVMIIIGLLIGGILKGQELIANAQTTATIAQIKGYDGALSTFRDKYAAFPGDMQNPNARLSNCTVNPCVPTTAADGNGRIDHTDNLTLPNGTNENTAVFPQMAAADLISGINPTGGAVFGGALPEAEMSGGMWVSYHPGGNITAQVLNAKRGHYLTFTGTEAAVADGTNTGINATQAAQIDRKLDDGDAESGAVRSTGAACRIPPVLPAVIPTGYDEANNGSSCAMFIRVQG